MILQYIASSGNVYDLNTRQSILTREANYHVWNWVPNGTELQFGTRIANFSREAAVYTTTLTFTGSTLQRKAIVENLHEDFELDVRNQTPGRIIWGDYYVDCYITASSTAPDDNLIWTDNEITIYCPYPFWIKEETRSFMPQQAAAGQTFLDFEYDFEYDYYSGPVGSELWATGFPFPSKFKMTIFGSCSSPMVTINGHIYQINDTLGATEYVVIDSWSNTIVKHTTAGTEENIFDKRNKASSIFQNIPGGNLLINWSGSFGFDLTLYRERSEPRWS